MNHAIFENGISLFSTKYALFEIFVLNFFAQTEKIHKFAAGKPISYLS